MINNNDNNTNNSPRSEFPDRIQLDPKEAAVKWTDGNWWLLTSGQRRHRWRWWRRQWPRWRGDVSIVLYDRQSPVNLQSDSHCKVATSGDVLDVETPLPEIKCKK